MRSGLFLPAALLMFGSAIPLIAQLRGVTDLSGNEVDPFSSHGITRVVLFVRTDCPITKRYAPELRRIAAEYAARPVQFWLVYPDPAETAANIRASIAEYQFPGTPILDPHQQLVKRAHARTAPEAAVFNSAGALVYHGRIDDLYVDVGKARPAAQVHDLEEAIAAALSGKPVRRPETRSVGCSLADVE